MAEPVDTVAVGELKARLSAVLDHVRRGHSVTVTAHRRAIARIEPLGPAAGMPAIPDVVWRGSGRKIGLHEPAALAGDGPPAADLLLAQRDAAR